jgi:hypothetical protein
MEKNSILSLHLVPNLCERMEKIPSSHYTWRQIFMRGWKKNSILSLHLAPNLRERMGKKFRPLTEYHRRFMLLALPIVVVVVLFIAFREQWLA